MLDELARFQDEVQHNVRKMSMSLGLNIKAFMKFVSKRLQMVNISLGRQGELISGMLAEHEQMQALTAQESHKMKDKMKTKISNLKYELAVIATELSTQKVEYNEQKAQTKFDLIINEERK